MQFELVKIATPGLLGVGDILCITGLTDPATGNNYDGNYTVTDIIDAAAGEFRAENADGFWVQARLPDFDSPPTYH